MKSGNKKNDSRMSRKDNVKKNSMKHTDLVYLVQNENQYQDHPTELKLFPLNKTLMKSKKSQLKLSNH